MDEAQAFRTPRALWLALVAIALGIAWFLCGGASSASAMNLPPDTPPVADASTPAPPTVSVPVAPALAAAETSLPAVPAAVVLPAISAAPEARTQPHPVEMAVGDTAAIATEVAVSDIDPLVTVSETAGAPIVAPLAALAPPVTIPSVTIPSVTIPSVIIPAFAIPTLTIPAVALPAVALPAVSIPATTAPIAPTAPVPPTSSVRPSAVAAQGDPGQGGPVATTAFASLTPADAAASAAGTPLGLPGHPVNLPQPSPVTAAAGGTGAVSVLAHHTSARASAIVAVRLTPEDDTLPSSLATDPGSSPA